ncbi:MAG: glycosyltransferase family 4 protein [Candidatus Harrisonbacteria bacterium CG10_big_fil_rev_8_21_14_0_10_42_17]|uniref:Glycosyltransferase family 4 protein n=1 Tax=Candidatus Harrisonbacteria bacterium CG10_big_fil_rev_8_21_14_0_10_42_17 TaxID=1974584 RepID=A0A2M6WJ67_9BACT|nr:MAG: glycosyltransferase family 4 protein [Candidatus Harrisonbacteria bacterium CG10_big_fil_rev_8_21_14_0_10_42_17]
MNVALVHDYLNQYGGAERVLESIMDLFPHAPIYTLLYDKERTMHRFDHRDVRTSFLDIGLVRREHRPFIPLMPAALRFMRLSGEYDLVISDSAGFAKGIRTHHNTFHLSYCHTPLRYVWEADYYFSNVFLRTLGRRALHALADWDRRVALRPNVLLANSSFIAGKIKRYYGLDVPVVYPAVSSSFYHDASIEPEDYFLGFGRFIQYKNFPLILNAFKQLPYRLFLVGGGRELSSLQRLARGYEDTVRFIPFGKSDDEIRLLYARARALIFPQVEDFGLVAAEAAMCGTPVIALRSGGACEIIRERETGLFFNEPTVQSLRDVITTFHALRFDRAHIAALSRDRFSLQRFQASLLDYIPRELHPVDL